METENRSDSWVVNLKKSLNMRNDFKIDSPFWKIWNQNNGVFAYIKQLQITCMQVKFESGGADHVGY